MDGWTHPPIISARVMSDAPLEKPRRRPRYRGSHPRVFHDKYKELNPERYAGEVAKVVAAGKTPAGMHRPIMVPEILEILAPKPGDFAVDATMGYGGHTAILLEAVRPGGRVLALDVDSDRAAQDRGTPPRDGHPGRRAPDPPEQFRRAGPRAGQRQPARSRCRARRSRRVVDAARRSRHAGSPSNTPGLSTCA